MIIGEPQILGQVKEAYQNASKKGASGVILNRLFHKAFSAAKRVRTETKIAKNPVSISFAAVELAKKIFVSLKEKTVLVIGAGEMSELALRHLISAGVHKIIIANRTYSRAQNLAREFKGEAIIFENLFDHLKKVDIIISSTGAPDFIIKYELIRKVVKERKNKPMFFIDTAVPRDIDSRINSLANVYLYDIDDLQGVVNDNLQERQKEVLKAEEIIDKEVDKFIGQLKVMEVTPIILSLKEKLEDIRKNELKKAIPRLGNIAEKEKDALESLTTSIINKIGHYPITYLKRKGNGNDASFCIDIVREIFHLDE
jgi:glutamyl-tRNA reductase